jgi:hypothetical protein
MEFISGGMAESLKAPTLTIESKAWVFTYGQMAELIMESGLRGNSMVLGTTSYLTKQTILLKLKRGLGTTVKDKIGPKKSVRRRMTIRTNDIKK